MENRQQGREDLAAANREFWNTHGNKIFGSQWMLNFAKKIGDALSENVEWMGIRRRSESGPPVKLLDYACGYGMVSSALLGQFDVIKGIDISDASVAAYNEMAQQSGVPPGLMVAVQGSIPAISTNTVLATEEFFDFDVIAISMALHHMGDQAGVISGLYERLRSGGVLVVVDLAPEAHVHDHSHDHAHGHTDFSSHHTISKHGGFEPEDMKALLAEAGFTPESFDYKLYPDTMPHVSNVPQHGTCLTSKFKPFFIAKGVKQ
ncbi:methyltransferase domain-containing protein [Trichoderma breve]|uniref:Methyltransferase domain-containing protein n=1 Tax=Trichoderma breve TaxID=2034170 RepID=A0A9W9B390_9HYPO|nr:methyltransferase domain-containing protein [Trichoderma breve]KAJ4854504.1 methyltransferase domain-containing protein [Trichoderma breve]